MRFLAWSMMVGALATGCGGPCEAAGTMCTVIGTGTNGFNGDGLPGEETWLYFPSALAWSPSGHLVVDDFNNMRIRVLQDDGTLATIAGTGWHEFAIPGEPALNSPLENPIDIAFDPEGRLLIAELHGARVLRVGDDDRIEVVAGNREVGFFGNDGPATEAWMSELCGLAVAADGTVLVSDTENHSVRAVGTDGIIRQLAGDASPGFDDGVAPRFRSPQRLRVDDDAGVAWLADTLNHAIRQIDLTTGATTTVLGDGSPGAEGGDGGPADAVRLNQPYSARPDSRGGLLVADTGNHRVLHLGADGTVRTVAGTGVAGFAAAPAPATETALDFPADVLPAPDGSIFIADLKNGAVRRVAGVLDPVEAP